MFSERQQQILEIFLQQAEKHWSIGDLLPYFEVGRTSLFRDLSAMGELGLIQADSALPLEEVDELFLLPEVVLLLVVLLPDLLVVLPDLDDVGLQLVQSLLLVLLPGLVLLVVSLFLLCLFGLFCVELLDRGVVTVLRPVMFSFFLSSSVLMRVSSFSMGSLRALTLVISSSSTSLRSSHCSSFISMLPELSASRSLRLSSMISSLRLFSSALEMSALMSLCSNSSSLSE